MPDISLFIGHIGNSNFGVQCSAETITNCSDASVALFLISIWWHHRNSYNEFHYHLIISTMEQRYFWASKRLSQQIGTVAKYENCSEDSLVRLILEKTFNEIWKEKGSEIENMLKGLEHFDQHLR